MSKIEITPGKTVTEAKVDKFSKALLSGKNKTEAAKVAGLTLEALRSKGVLGTVVKSLLARVEEDKLLKRETLESIARAKALELMMQDEDLKVSLGAVRAILGNGPQVAVQVNNHYLKTDPEVLASLKSLGLDMEEEEDGQR